MTQTKLEISCLRLGLGSCMMPKSDRWLTVFATLILSVFGMLDACGVVQGVEFIPTLFVRKHDGGQILGRPG